MDDIYIFHKDKVFLQNLLIQIQDILTGLKLEINQKKTHITKIKYGYTYLQIKYNIGTNGVIRRPSHNKIVDSVVVLKLRIELLKLKQLVLRMQKIGMKDGKEASARTVNNVTSQYIIWIN